MSHSEKGRAPGRPLLLLMVAAALLVTSACGGSSTGSSKAAKSAVNTGGLPQAEADTGTIKVASLPIPHNVQFIDLNRFAKKYGLNVEWESFQRYSDTQLAVARGDVAFAAAGYHTITLDTAPTSVKILAGGNSGAQALVMRKDVKVTKWSDLAGKRIGVAPNSGPDVQFTLAARQAGFDPASIKRVNFTTIGPPTLVALRNHDIDGMLCWELTCAQAVAEGQGYYAPVDIGDNPTHNANTLLLGNTDWVKAHPNATTLLVKAYVDAVEHFKADQKDWVAAVTAATGADSPEVLKTALGNMTLEWKLYKDRLLATAKAYAEFGISKRDMSDQVLQLADYKYLERATGKNLSEVGG